MRKFRKAKKPDMDGINLLVSILGCYPEIGMVSYEPKEDALHLSFGLKAVPARESYEAAAKFIEESIMTYHNLEGFSHAQIEISLEAQENAAFLHIVRDVFTLSRGEIALITTLMREHFGAILLRDEEKGTPDDEQDNAVQEEAIDHMIGSLKINHVNDRMIGIREEGRVMVFNK